MSESMKICTILLSLLVASLCHAINPLQVQSIDELAAEIKIESVNPEIDFDQTLQNHNLTSFRTLLIKAKLFDTLNDTRNSHTVFAPTNAAILNAKVLLQNTTRLPEVLMYHVHLGAFPTDRIEQNMRLKTLLGGQKKIRFERYRGVIYGSCQPFGSVKDLTYNNGMLDIMNGVMVPPEGDIYDILGATPTYSSFLNYVNKGRLQRLLTNPTPTTLLIPNNAAFGKLPNDVTEKMDNDYSFLRKVLEYHVLEEIMCSAGFENGHESTYQGEDISVAVSGKKVVFNSNSTLIQPDIIAYNGVMQVIDTVLLPPTEV